MRCANCFVCTAVSKVHSSRMSCHHPLPRCWQLNDGVLRARQTRNDARIPSGLRAPYQVVWPPSFRPCLCLKFWANPPVKTSSHLSRFGGSTTTDHQFVIQNIDTSIQNSDHTLPQFNMEGISLLSTGRDPSVHRIARYSEGGTSHSPEATSPALALLKFANLNSFQPKLYTSRSVDHSQLLRLCCKCYQELEPIAPLFPSRVPWLACGVRDPI